MKQHPLQIHSETWTLNNKVNLIVTKATNGPIFSWGFWNGKTFTKGPCGKMYSFTNTFETALAYLKKCNQI